MATINWTHGSSPVTSTTQTLVQQSKNNGINWTWKSLSDVSRVDSTKKDIYFAWQFEWEELIKQGIKELDGTITVSYNVHPNYASYTTIPNVSVPGFPKTFAIQLARSGQWVEHCIGSEDVVVGLFRNYYQFRCTFDIKPIKNSEESQILEETFAASDKTDAILMVEGKKLHVNKQFLSFHSEFFNTLFNSEFKEKSMDEIPIKDVKYEDFAHLLSVIYPNPILPTVETSTSLLELADRFMVPKVTRLVEPFLIRNESVRISEKISIADKYSLNELLESSLKLLKSSAEVKKITETAHFEGLSDATKVKLFYKTLPFL